jgi:hypothetical protein
MARALSIHISIHINPSDTTSNGVSRQDLEATRTALRKLGPREDLVSD